MQESADQLRLKELLSKLDVPKQRCEFGHWNLLWLTQNLFIRNSAHVDFAEANELVKKLLREHFS